MFSKIDDKSTATVVSEWDALAPIRLRQIVTCEDITYRHILIPSILNLLPNKPAQIALDAGCGIGFLTDLITDYAKEVIGIDPSAESISIARSQYGRRAKFYLGTLESYSEDSAGPADLIIANMVLMDVLDLDGFVAAAHRALRPGGTMIFSTSHPCFWPDYYGYSHEPWFKYNQEHLIEGPFRITAEPNCPLLSTHVHRPRATYFKAFRTAQFAIEELHEPMPPAEVEAQYPDPWIYPRYLVGLCRR